MSVIERMIQRTRAQDTSGVRPLLPPRFAASVVAPESHTALLELHPVNSLDSSADLPASVSRTRASFGEDSETDSSSPTLPERSLRQEPEGFPLADRRRSSNSRGDENPISAIPQVANRPPSQDRKEIAAGNSAERSPQNSTEPIHSPFTQFTVDRVRAVSQQDDMQSSVSNSAPHRFSSENDSGEKRTAPDVSITIGHIEVHAAQPAERISRPVFRPRVSLDDFLGQINGKQP